MTEINVENLPVPLKIIKVNRIQVKDMPEVTELVLDLDSSDFSDYKMNGLIENVKIPINVNYDDWSTSYKNPQGSDGRDLVTWDGTK